MKLACVVLVLYILAFASAQDSVAGHRNHRGNSVITRIQETGSSPSTLPKSRESPVSTGHKSNPTVRKSSTSVSKSSYGDPKTVPTRHPAANSTTRTPAGKLTTSATKTVTVSKGQTAIAQVGWVVVGVGIGGSVAVVGGNVVDVAGGTIGVVEENSSGQDELSTIDTTSRSKSSSTKSSSSTASPTPYNIYPRPGSTPSQQSAFARNLKRIAQPGSIRSITGIRDRQLLWVASLTPVQASELGRNPVVHALNVNRSLRVNLERGNGDGTHASPICPPESCSHQKRDGDILLQANARDDLKMFSQARGALLSGLAGYAYDSMGGDEMTVYVVDTGVDPGHAEFRNMEGTIRWLYLPDEPEIEGDDVGHGTCVTSKIVGPTFGVAKNVDIVIVKIYPINGRIEVSRFIAAWGVVAGDIASKNLQGKAVVSVAIGVDPNGISENDRIAYVEGVRVLIDLDAVVVVASGNRDADLPGFAVATYPALLVNQFPIIVVGAVETSGVYAHYSQGLAAELTVSAPGTVHCASLSGGAVEMRGTSFAAPAVAGLAAYLMSLEQYRTRLQEGSVATNVRDLIKSLAYARLPLQPLVVWNNIDSRQIHCPVRRDASSGCPALNTTLPIVPPIPSQSPPKVTMTSESSGGAGSRTITVPSPSFSITTSAGSSDLSSPSIVLNYGGKSSTATLTTPLGRSSGSMVTAGTGGVV